MGKYRKGYNALGDALRRRAEADQLAMEEPTMPTDQSDPVDFERADGCVRSLSTGYRLTLDGTKALATAYVAARAREKRLEALVQRAVDAFAGYERSGMLGCLTTGIGGLVEAARKELENG